MFINIPLYLDSCFSRERDKAFFQNSSTIWRKIASSCCVPHSWDRLLTGTVELKWSLFQVWMHKVYSWEETIYCQIQLGKEEENED